ncbi:hypothetical protein ACOSP7_019007 [Xanthoceras sorbifolium]
MSCCCCCLLDGVSPPRVGHALDRLYIKKEKATTTFQMFSIGSCELVMASLKVSMVALLLLEAMLVLVLNFMVRAYEDEIAPSPMATGSALASSSSASVAVVTGIAVAVLFYVYGVFAH